MATSTFPTLITGVTVQTATTGSLSGDGSSGNKLAVGVDGVTIDVNGSNQLQVISGSEAPVDASYLTVDDETAVLTGSRQLLAGSNITFDDTAPGARTLATAAALVADTFSGSGNAETTITGNGSVTNSVFVNGSAAGVFVFGDTSSGGAFYNDDSSESVSLGAFDAIDGSGLTNRWYYGMFQYLYADTVNLTNEDGSVTAGLAFGSTISADDTLVLSPPASGIISLAGDVLASTVVSAPAFLGDWVGQPLATPAAPTIVQGGTPGITTYSYKVVALTTNGHTLPSAAGTTNTGFATLDGTHSNDVIWVGIKGATAYDVYRTVGGATQGKIASGVTANDFSDTGIVASGSAPAANTTGAIQPAIYKSSDGTAGAAGGSFTAITSITVKDGIITAIAGT